MAAVANVQHGEGHGCWLKQANVVTSTGVVSGAATVLLTPHSNLCQWDGQPGWMQVLCSSFVHGLLGQLLNCGYTLRLRQQKVDNIQKVD